MIIDHDLPKFCGAAAIEYQYLELKVRRLITRVCAPFCRECIDCCCKKDFCSESIDSFWLNLVWQMGDHDISQYDATHGWLSSVGCKLTIGRPPVCYEFLCDKIREGISKNPPLNCLKDISKLVRFTGKKALGNNHLVILSSKQILKQLDFIRLRRRIAKSFELYKQYEKKIRPHLMEGPVRNEITRNISVC